MCASRGRAIRAGRATCRKIEVQFCCFGRGEIGGLHATVGHPYLAGGEMTTELMNAGIFNTPLPVELVGEYLTYAENELTALYSAVSQLFGLEQAQLAVEDWLTELEAMEWPGELPIPDWRRPTVTAVSRLADRIGGHERLCGGGVAGGCGDVTGERG